MPTRKPIVISEKQNAEWSGSDDDPRVRLMQNSMKANWDTNDARRKAYAVAVACVTFVIGAVLVTIHPVLGWLGGVPFLAYTLAQQVRYLRAKKASDRYNIQYERGIVELPDDPPVTSAAS